MMSHSAQIPKETPINSNHDVSQCAELHDHFLLVQNHREMRQCLALAIDTAHTAPQPHRSIAQYLTKCGNPVRDFADIESLLPILD